MVHLSESNGRFKLVCALVDSLEGQHFLSGTSHGLFRPRVPVDRFFEQLLRIGVTQHSVVADGDWRKPLRDLSAMADIDYYEVGRPAETVLS